MRVALVHDFHSSDSPSGENEVVDAEAAALREAGVDVRVVAVTNDEQNARPLHRLRAISTIATGFGISPIRMLDGFEPDVIHVHNLFPYLGHRWLQNVEQPVVATMHSYRPLCANGYLYRAGDVCTLCPSGRRWSGVRHGCYRGSRLATVPLAWAGRKGAASDPLVVAARRVLVLSERARSVFAEAGVPESKLHRDWHFVPDSHDPGYGTDRDERWVFVGRLTEEKGIAPLVDEWPASVPLLVVGDGPMRSSLEQAAKGKDIRFAGRLSRPEVLMAMRESFGLVMPSLWYETISLVYLEALAAGLPVVAFRPNVVADSVERDGTGLVASWGSLASSLEEGHRGFDALRAHCRSLFCDRYAQSAFVTRRTKLYAELVA